MRSDATPDPGRRYYYLELDYVVGRDDGGQIKDPVFFERCARGVARCVARWADHVLAYSRLHRDFARSGPLPTAPSDKHAAIDGVFDWFASLPDPLEACSLRLERGGEPILNQSDGLATGSLRLTDDEFAELQACLDLHGLPRDLYFPADALRTVTEPAPAFGGVVRRQRAYTPRE